MPSVDVIINNHMQNCKQFSDVVVDCVIKGRLTGEFRKAKFSEGNGTSIALDTEFHKKKVVGLKEKLGTMPVPKMSHSRLLLTVKDHLKGQDNDLCRPKCTTPCPMCDSSCDRSLFRPRVEQCEARLRTPAKRSARYVRASER